MQMIIHAVNRVWELSMSQRIVASTKGIKAGLAFITLLSVGSITTPAFAQQKVALVIGNSNYKIGPLKNPVNDAIAMSGTLKRLGFNRVDTVLNADRKKLFNAIRNFSKQVRPGSVAVVYFSGHGAQYRNSNYLLPINVDAEYDDELPVQAINAELIMDKMHTNQNGLNIVIFDACRNNTLKKRNRSTTRGLARIDHSPPNTYLIYSTAPGSVAADNERENNGLFTKHLINYIQQPGLDLDSMMIETRKAVLKASNNRQNPFDTGSLTTRFCFAGCDKGASNVANRPVAPVTQPITPARPVTPARPAVVATRPAASVTQPVARPSRPVTPASGFEPQMVNIPAGRFTMGCDPARDAVLGGCDNDEKPAIPVTVSAFQMSKTEVTFNQWDACTKEGACIKAQDQGWGRGNLPVINVSWNDVQTYIKWLRGKTGKRYQLPTEAQWEYAARAGRSHAFPWGKQINCGLANYGNYKNECPTDRTKRAGSFRPNGYGIYDTAGNVWEWTQDCWSANHQGASPQGRARANCGASAKRVVRGGSWSNDSRIIRSASRHGYNPTDRSRIIGLRLVLTP